MQCKEQMKSHQAEKSCLCSYTQGPELTLKSRRKYKLNQQQLFKQGPQPQFLREVRITMSKVNVLCRLGGRLLISLIPLANVTCLFSQKVLNVIFNGQLSALLRTQNLLAIYIIIILYTLEITSPVFSFMVIKKKKVVSCACMSNNIRTLKCILFL